MARFILVNVQSRRILKIASAQFPGNPALSWVDVSDRPEDDATLMHMLYVDGDFVEPTPIEVVPVPDPVALAQLANTRLDRGIEQGYDALNRVGEGIEARKRTR